MLRHLNAIVLTTLVIPSACRAVPQLRDEHWRLSSETFERRMPGSAGASPAVSRASRDTIGSFSARRRNEPRKRSGRSPDFSSFVIDSSFVIRHSSFSGHDTSHSSFLRYRSNRFALFISRSCRCIRLHRNDDVVWHRAHRHSSNCPCA